MMNRTLTAALAAILVSAALAAQAAPAASPSPDASPAASPAATASAEDDDSGDLTTFAPFINRLRVAVKEPQVRLTWEDIANFAGSYRVYRHSAEIGLDNLDAAVLAGEVSQGEQFFTDIPPATGSYFYAVLARQPDGNLYKVFIPFRNKTLSAVSITVAPKAEDLASEIGSFKADVVGQSIEVNLTSSRNTRNVAVFRSTAPIASAADVLKAVQVWTGTGRTIKVEDFAVPGVPYYYAAVDTESFQKGNWTISIPKNSLDKPVEIPLGTRPATLAGLESAKPVRAMPLPVLTLPDLGSSQLVLEGTNARTVPQTLDSVTKTRIQALTAKLKSGQAGQKAAELLPSDRLVQEGRALGTPTGDAKVLAEIISKHFTRTNWDESIRQINNLLTLPLSRDVQVKAHFYLAQSYYQNKHYKEALLEFLYVQDDLPDQAQGWIEDTLEKSSSW